MNYARIFTTSIILAVALSCEPGYAQAKEECSFPFRDKNALFYVCTDGVAGRFYSVSAGETRVLFKGRRIVDAHRVGGGLYGLRLKNKTFIVIDNAGNVVEEFDSSRNAYLAKQYNEKLFFAAVDDDEGLGLKNAQVFAVNGQKTERIPFDLPQNTMVRDIQFVGKEVYIASGACLHKYRMHPHILVWKYCVGGVITAFAASTTHRSVFIWGGPSELLRLNDATGTEIRRYYSKAVCGNKIEVEGDMFISFAIDWSGYCFYPAESQEFVLECALPDKRGLSRIRSIGISLFSRSWAENNLECTKRQIRPGGIFG